VTARMVPGMRRGRRWAIAAAAVCGFAVAASGGDAQVTTARVSAFPSPGTVAARAETQISLRGAPASQLGTITVTGERSGAHPGRLLEHSDGRGASFVPDAAFAQGERVIVRTGLDVAGGRGGAFSFVVPRRPSPKRPESGKLPLPKLPPAATDHFRSRGDLHAPSVRIMRRRKGISPGYVLLAPFSPQGGRQPDGPLIADNRGELVWFKPVRRGTAVTDLKVQQLGGKRVLTWWEGRFALGWGYGAYTVLDGAYRRLASIRPGNGYAADLHDMQLTGRGTALVLAYDRVKRDLRFAGGVKHGFVLDNVVQEVDLATGLVLFEWHSLGEIKVTDSRTRPQGPRSWDYFHINAVEVDRDGNLIISARNTCALYKLDRETGEVLWQLGGRGGDFKMGKGTRFCFQHDVRRAGPGTLSLFDNSAGPPVLRKQSRAITLAVDERARTVRLRRQYEHGLLALNQGSMRVQPNGNAFVGWGGAGPVFSEFSPRGRLLLDGRLTKGKGNYRAIRARWRGQPTRPPAIAARRSKRGRVIVYASWNGATEVVRWQVLANGRGVASTARDGFETQITARTRARRIAVRALDARGRVIGTSRAVRP
jgi:hypothetical protein